MDVNIQHNAMLSNDVTATKHILSQKLVNVNSKNEKTGDQSSHIAARKGNLECIRVLMEYDVDMNRRNWNGLTPCGEARMNGHTKIVELIEKSYYNVGHKQKSQSKWDDMIENMTASWEETWDTNTNAKVWVRKYNGEIKEKSFQPPSIDVDFIIAARDYQQESVIRKYDPNVPLAVAVSPQLKIANYIDERTKEQKIIEQMRLERKLCCMLQNLWRGYLARKLRRRKALELRSLILIQKCFRVWTWKIRYHLFSWKKTAAVKIQSYQRMRSMNHYYKYFLWERLWWHRAARILALHGQYVWRRYKSRIAKRRIKAISTLPNPKDVINYDYWLDIQKLCNPPIRRSGIFTEYHLNFKKDYHRVKFYVNNITNKAMWDQPNVFLLADKEDFIRRNQVRLLGFTVKESNSAKYLQLHWRARTVRKNFKLVLKAMRIAKHAEEKYFDNPKDIKALCNYALYVHLFENDYDKARVLYDNMFNYMEDRRIDNAFVLYCNAIFLAFTGEEDWYIIKEFVSRANASIKLKIDVFDLANAGFFRQATIHNNKSFAGDSWHSYALCRMLVYSDFHGAKGAFINAIMASSQDLNIVRNFDVLLHDSDYMGMSSDWSVFDECRAAQLSRKVKTKRVIR